MAIDFKARMKRPVQLDIIDPVININTNVNINTNIMQQPPKYTEVHKATMVYIENELSSELDVICKGKKGMKSKIVNEALNDFFKKVNKR